MRSLVLAFLFLATSLFLRGYEFKHIDIRYNYSIENANMFPVIRIPFYWNNYWNGYSKYSSIEYSSSEINSVIRDSPLYNKKSLSLKQKEVTATILGLESDSFSGDIALNYLNIKKSEFGYAIKKYDKGTVTIEIGAVAASIASYIALAGDKVTANTNSTYMIHEARASVWAGTAKEMMSKAAAIDGINSLYVAAYTKRTGKSDEDVKTLMDAETYFFGSSIMENGFADKVLTDGEVAASLVDSRNRIAACKNNCKARPVNAKPPVAHVEPNEFALEVNKIMEKI